MANDGDISTGNGAFQRTVMVSAQRISTFTPLMMGLEVELMDLSSESHRIRPTIYANYSNYGFVGMGHSEHGKFLHWMWGSFATRKRNAYQD